MGRLLRSSTTVSLFVGMGVLVGLAVDVLIVARFGIGSASDTFFGAYTVPFIIVTRLAAVQPVLVPVFVQHRDNRSAMAVVMNAAALLGLGVAAIGMLLARPLIAVTTPGFAPATAAQAAVLARILFAEVPAAAVAEVCKAELYARQRFAIAAVSGVIPGIVTAAVLVAIGGVPALSAAGQVRGLQLLAASYAAGAVAQAALLAGTLFGWLRVPYRWTVRHPTPILRETGRLVLAPLAALFLRQGVTLTERILGSFLSPGSVTALSYANRLNTIVAGVFFDGVTTASLPSLAEHWARGRAEAVRSGLVTLLKLMATIAIPLGLAVSALSRPLVLLFFERGQVAHSAALLMGTVVGVYSLSLPFLGPFRAVQNFFYAAKRMRPIVLLHGGLAALAVLLDVILVWKLQALGLALGYAVSCAVITAASLVWFGRWAGTLRPQGGRELANSFWRLGVASLAMGAVAFGASHWLEAATGGAGRWGLVANVAGSGVAALAVFVALGALLRLEAITMLWSKAREIWLARV